MINFIARVRDISIGTFANTGWKMKNMPIILFLLVNLNLQISSAKNYEKKETCSYVEDLSHLSANISAQYSAAKFVCQVGLPKC